MNTLIAMSTQWRLGPSGFPTGLDYTALPAVMRFAGVPRAFWPDTFECVRVMEAEAMAVMSEDRK